MRPITLLLALILTSCNSSCGGTNTPTVNWPRVATCTEPAHGDVLKTVQEILIAPEDGDSTTIGDRAVRELTELAKAKGEHVVACLVDEAVRSFERMINEPSTVAALPPEQPARKSMPRSAPSPVVPVETLPDDATETSAREAAARGRDFLQRVAKTKVNADDAAHGVEP